LFFALFLGGDASIVEKLILVLTPDTVDIMWNVYIALFLYSSVVCVVLKKYFIAIEKTIRGFLFFRRGANL
jgi:hypothetical protein